MCLSIAIHRPADVLARGEHAGLEWMVVHNGNGYRCGYVRVPVGHPWHGMDLNDVPASVHGGITFAEPDLACGKGGEDDAYWVGFDCAHAWDAPDPALPQGPLSRSPFLLGDEHIWTQAEVESECRCLCEQAASAASAVVA